MHQNNFVVAVKSNGNILRENDNKIFLPFGSEYSLLFKNLDSRKVKVGIKIDGQDVLDRKSLILFPNNESFELEGFLTGNIARNKFKFIKKTDEISNHRGDRLDDGIIRIEFTFEKKIKTTITNSYTYTSYQPNYYNSNSDYFSNFSDKYSPSYSSSLGNHNTLRCVNINARCSETPRNIKNDEGITVKGSETNQQFNYGYIGELEETSNVITLCLKGTKNGNVTKPLTVKTKLICPTCGRSFDSNFKYCSNCGTFLEIS